MEANLTAQIMIVEGNQSSMQSLLSHLADFTPPLRILTATDVETALEELQKETSDLILIDAYLRGRMDGFDLCRVLRSPALNRTQNLPIILLLSSYLSLERSKGLSSGADLLLYRPIIKEELSKMIRLLLHQKFSQEKMPRLRTGENGPVQRLLQPNREKLPSFSEAPPRLLHR